ncbi:MAG: hypothetical protein U5K27_14515 [Desulfotignum sp.]|nr:hypothetical protein [Desulfotignum sp.]
MNLDRTTSGAILSLTRFKSTPHALQLLRYLYEEKKGLPVMAGRITHWNSGTLLGSLHFQCLVGRIEYMHLGPMTFTKFLLAADAGLNRDM